MARYPGFVTVPPLPGVSLLVINQQELSMVPQFAEGIWFTPDHSHASLKSLLFRQTVCMVWFAEERKPHHAGLHAMEMQIMLMLMLRPAFLGQQACQCRPILIYDHCCKSFSSVLNSCWGDHFALIAMCPPVQGGPVQEQSHRYAAPRFNIKDTRPL